LYQRRTLKVSLFSSKSVPDGGVGEKAAVGGHVEVRDRPPRESVVIYNTFKVMYNTFQVIHNAFKVTCAVHLRLYKIHLRLYHPC
jgi:hypothetical protein